MPLYPDHVTGRLEQYRRLRHLDHIADPASDKRFILEMNRRLQEVERAGSVADEE